MIVETLHNILTSKREQKLKEGYKEGIKKRKIRGRKTNVQRRIGYGFYKKITGLSEKTSLRCTKLFHENYIDVKNDFENIVSSLALTPRCC